MPTENFDPELTLGLVMVGAWPELSVAFGSTHETAKPSRLSVYFFILSGHVSPKLGGSSSINRNEINTFSSAVQGNRESEMVA